MHLRDNNPTKTFCGQTADVLVGRHERRHESVDLGYFGLEYTVTHDGLVIPLLPRTTLGDYIVDRLLGQGGFGSTHFAVDQCLQKPVAVKELAPHGIVHRHPDGRLKPNEVLLVAAFEAMKQDFLAEARLLATRSVLSRAVR
jgi:serine/threonine protein kinase